MLLFNAFANIVDETKEQYHSDKIIYNGDTMNLDGDIFAKICCFEYNDGIYFKYHYYLLKELLEKKYYKKEIFYNYNLEFEVIENQLYLIKINLNYDNSDDTIVNLKELFGKNFINGKVKADWVSQNLISHQGKILYHIYEDSDVSFESDIEFQIRKGKLVRFKTYDNSKARKSNFMLNFMSITEQYNFFYKNIKWSILPKLGKDEVYVRLRFSANEKGVVDRVNVEKGYNEVFDKEAIRVVKAIPDWSVCYIRGRFKRKPMTICVNFNRIIELSKVNFYEEK